MVSWNEPNMWEAEAWRCAKVLLSMWGHMHQKQILYYIHRYKKMSGGVHMPIKNRKKAYSPSLLRNHIHGCRSELCQRPMQSCDVHIPEITREWNNDSSHQPLDTACSSSGVILSSPQSWGTPVTLHVLRPCASPRFPVSFRTLAAHAGPLSCGYRLVHWVTNHASPPESDNSGAAKTLRVRNNPLLWILKGFALAVFQLL